MRKLRIINSLLYTLIFSLFLSSCVSFNFLSSRIKLLSEETNNEEKIKENDSTKLIKCINDKDIDGLMSLLCVKTKNIKNISEQLSYGIEFIKGKIVSYDNKYNAIVGKSYSYGETTEFDIGWNINDIVTDTGDKYEIYIFKYQIFKDDEDREGIAQITITNNSGDESIIGYRWPEHYKEGRKISRDLISSLGINDDDGIKTLLCDKTLELNNIDVEINDAIEFFEGKALEGDVPGDNLIYDGKHDYHTTVYDNETIENYQPVCTYINVYNVNIETNAKKIYEMEFYAYIINNDDKSLEGISQIIITNDNGKQIRIGEKLPFGK